MIAKWIVAIGIGLLAAQAFAGEKRALKTQEDKASYAMAVAVAKNIQRQGVEVDVEAFARGLKDALSGGELLMSEDELRQAMSGVLGEAKRKQAEAEKTAQENRKNKGQAFLAENAKKEGVVSLPSGLQYKVLEAGNGTRPTDADAVVCHYRGTFIDGNEFDSSLRRGKPATFKLARVIPGWREALKLMPVGARWQIFVPPSLGYGARGTRKGKIGPNETLVFEIQILAVKAASARAGAEQKTAEASPPESRKKM